MAIYGAFSASMLGMMSQSQSLDTIGLNIANVNTGGYKRSETRFATILSKTLDHVSDNGGVRPKDYQRIDQQGVIVASARNFDTAINGHGLYVLNTERDGSGETFYTRDGSFSTTPGDPITVLASDGVTTINTTESYLTDKTGKYVMGWASAQDGTINLTDTFSAMRVDSYAFSSEGVATTEASFVGNLPADQVVGDDILYNVGLYDSGGNSRVVTMTFAVTESGGVKVANSWDVSFTSTDTPTAQVDTLDFAATGTIEAGDVYTATVNGIPVSYTSQASDTTIDDIMTGLATAMGANPSVAAVVTAVAAGGQITLTANSAGTAFTSSVSWTDNNTVDIAGTSTVTTPNNDGATTTAPVTLTFDGNGKVIAPTTLNFTGTWTGNGGGTITTTMDISDLNQYVGEFTPYTFLQNGYGAGELRDMAFDSQGHMVASFTNAVTRPVYRLPLAVFPNVNSLEMTNGNLFRETPDSGSAQIIAPDAGGFGYISPGSRELSNVNIGQEFTAMITTQTAYNASSTVFRTVDEMITVARDLK